MMDIPSSFLLNLTLPSFHSSLASRLRALCNFFIRDDDYYGANFELSLDMASLGDDANFRVLYHPDVVEDTARLDISAPTYHPPEDKDSLPCDPIQEFVLKGNLVSGPITSNDRLFKHIVGQSLWQIGQDQQDSDVDSMMKSYVQLSGEGHKLGGYPTFTQQDPRQPEDTHVLLFQLDSDCDLKIMWGDMGTGNFFITPDDLARADFRRVVYHWDCS